MTSKPPASQRRGLGAGLKSEIYPAVPIKSQSANQPSRPDLPRQYLRLIYILDGEVVAIRGMENSPHMMGVRLINGNDLK
ncbi:MAG: hypothetical protein A4E57_03143 [Syntrophorhabdaceae bacterium PtaU1.Bin034]|nr:MAG: hypothetical protein A4E57_03143 [Syntrophorhabdaceae bacterium PtaU1.Bin034]